MKYEIGQSAQVTKTITETDVYLFAGVTGDMNPAHVNEVYAQGTRFQHRIAHGVLSAGLISAALGMYLPGPGSIYMGQGLKFRAPVYIGDTITAVVTITALDTEKNRAVLETKVVNQEGKPVVTGEATLLLPN